MGRGTQRMLRVCRVFPARTAVLWRSFQQQYARAALPGSHRRTQSCVPASDHKDVKFGFFCAGRLLRYFHAI